MLNTYNVESDYLEPEGPRVPYDLAVKRKTISRMNCCVRFGIIFFMILGLGIIALSLLVAYDFLIFWRWGQYSVLALGAGLFLFGLISIISACYKRRKSLIISIFLVYIGLCGSSGVLMYSVITEGINPRMIGEQWEDLYRDSEQEGHRKICNFEKKLKCSGWEYICVYHLLHSDVREDAMGIDVNSNVTKKSSNKTKTKTPSLTPSLTLIPFSINSKAMCPKNCKDGNQYNKTCKDVTAHILKYHWPYISVLGIVIIAALVQLIFIVHIFVMSKMRRRGETLPLTERYL